MSNTFLPYTKPTISPAALAAVRDVLESGWLTSGPRVLEFEERFAAYVGAEHAVATSSCTGAFHLALAALDIGPGDEVISPSLTWPAAVNQVELRGATVVFADVDPGTLVLRPQDVEVCLSSRTRAVLPVHFAGQCVDVPALETLAADRSVRILEDAAHAVGAESHGARVGSGDVCLFSLHASKNMTTGEGGMLTTGDEELASRCRALRFHGVDHDAWKRHGVSEPGEYDVIEPGWKLNMTDMQAALGLVQLAELDEWMERRGALAAHYNELLHDVDAVTPLTLSAATERHAWHLYVVVLDSGCAPRREVRAALREEGIGTGLHYRPVHELSYYAKKYDAQLPGTEDVGRRIMSLPLFPSMGARDVERVVAALCKVLS